MNAPDQPEEIRFFLSLPLSEQRRLLELFLMLLEQPSGVEQKPDPWVQRPGGIKNKNKQAAKA